MATHGYRPGYYDNPSSESEGLWSCTPDGACRFIPNSKNNHQQQQKQQEQGCVMKFETSFEQLQPSPNHRLVVKDPQKPTTMEEFFTNLQTEASRPPFPNISQPPTTQRFQIPISSPGPQDRSFFADYKPNNKQHKEREPTYGHGHGGWDGDGHGYGSPPHQQHQFIGKSGSNNHSNDGKGKGDRWTTKEAAPALWTNDPRWMSMKSSDHPHDNRLTKPVNDIDEATKHLKELATIPQKLPTATTTTKKAENNMHTNNINNNDDNARARQPPQSYNSYKEAMSTITSAEAAKKYRGHLVN